MLVDNGIAPGLFAFFWCLVYEKRSSAGVVHTVPKAGNHAARDVER